MDAIEQPLLLVDFVDEPCWKRSTGAIAPYRLNDHVGELEDARGKKFRLTLYFTTQAALSKNRSLGSTVVMTIAPIGDGASTLDQKSLVTLKQKVRDFCHRVAESKRPMHRFFGFRAWFLVPAQTDESTLNVINQIYDQIRLGVTSGTDKAEVVREQFATADEFRALCRFLKNEIRARVMELSLEDEAA